MNRRLKKIGTAIFDIVGFINFRLQETKGNCWISYMTKIIGEKIISQKK